MRSKGNRGKGRISGDDKNKDLKTTEKLPRKLTS